MPSDEIVQKVDALTVEQVREAGRRLLQGRPAGGNRPDQGPALVGTDRQRQLRG